MRTLKNSLFTLALALMGVPLATAQKPNDSSFCFHDDLLDKLVGTWNVHAIAHGFAGTGKIEAKWALAHQHLYLHFMGNEVIPWIKGPMEFEYFIGYKHSTKKYVVHGMSVFGDDDYEGFCYAERNGNELNLMQKNPCTSEEIIVQRFTWNPSTKTWSIQSWNQNGDKPGEVFLDLKLEKAIN